MRIGEGAQEKQFVTNNHVLAICGRTLVDPCHLRLMQTWNLVVADADSGMQSSGC